MENSSKQRLWIWLLLAISLSLNLYGITWGLPNGDQDWANDSIAPLGPLVYAKSMLYQEPWSSKYPPFHYMVLTLLYAPYAVYLYVTGDLTAPTAHYPYGLRDPQFALMILTLIARVASALMGTGIVLVSYLTVKLLYGRVAGLISGFLLATSCAVIYYSHNANIDVPQLFWISLALYSFVCLLNTYETRHYVLLGIFSAFAIGTKDSAYALFPGLAISLIWFHIRHEQATSERHRWLSALFHRKLLYGFCTFVIALILVFNIPFNWQGFVEHVQFHLGRTVRVSGVIKQSASIVQGDLTLIGRYLFYFSQAGGLPAFLLLVVGFLYCLARFPQKSWPLVIPIVTYYLFFLRATGTSHLRYGLPVYLILTWQAGKLASDLMVSKKIPRLLSTAAVLLILVYSGLYGLSLDLLLLRDSRYAAERWMEQNIPGGAVIAALRPEYSLPRFPVGAKVRHVNNDRRYEIVGDVESEWDDYVVVDISLPGRIKHMPKIYRLLHERGFCPIASFKTEPPLFSSDVFHAVNPNIVVFQHNHQPALCIEVPDVQENHSAREGRLLAGAQ